MTDASVYVTRDEVTRAIELTGRKPSHARIGLFLRFLWLTGCRVSEALGASSEHLDTGLGVVRLRTLKKKKETWRALPLPADFMASLADLGPGPLFPWSRAHAYKLVRHALEAAGVDAPRAHPHAIRHGHGVHATRNNVPLNVLQRVFGHASIATTGVYLQVTGKDVSRYYDSVVW